MEELNFERHQREVIDFLNGNKHLVLATCSDRHVINRLKRIPMLHSLVETFKLKEELKLLVILLRTVILSRIIKGTTRIHFEITHT